MLNSSAFERRLPAVLALALACALTSAWSARAQQSPRSRWHRITRGPEARNAAGGRGRFTAQPADL